MKWTEKELEIIKKVNSKEELLKLIPNRTWDGIRKIRSKTVPEKVKRCLKWSNNEINIVIDNYEKMTKEEITKLLPLRTWESIKLKANGLKINRSFDFLRKSNMNILLENTVESFYWIGFLLADGYINDFIRLDLTLSIKDLDHLIKFSKYVECDNIQKDETKCSIALQNREVCPKICEKFKINIRKTYNPINIIDYQFDKELIFSLIIGFIDGDGCINKVYKRQDCNLRIHLHKSWLDNLIFMEDFIYRYFKRKKERRLSKIGNDGYSLLSISDNEIINNLKKECIRLCLPIMDRKWKRIDENKISRNILFRNVKSDIIKLYESGLSPLEIISKLDLKKGVVYKHLRNYNKLTCL